MRGFLFLPRTFIATVETTLPSASPVAVMVMCRSGSRPMAWVEVDLINTVVDMGFFAFTVFWDLLSDWRP